MTRTWRASVTIAALVLIGGALAGCPKRPELAPTAAPGAPAAPGAQPAPATPGVTPGAAPGTPPSAAEAGPTPAPGAGPGPAGVTAPAAPAPGEFVEVATLRNVHFDFDRYAIRPDDAQILERTAQWLKTHATALVLIEGHCDERGTDEYNLALGERRARATRDYLVSLGIDGGRISTISYGKERPVCAARTEACWAENRRAHFLVKLGNP